MAGFPLLVRLVAWFVGVFILSDFVPFFAYLGLFCGSSYTILTPQIGSWCKWVKHGHYYHTADGEG